MSVVRIDLLIMSIPGPLISLTHIIIDEVHERDSFSDFLLTVIKKALVNFPDLRLVLMSATAEVDLFKKYFPGAVNLSVPGRVHHVSEVFLEDILAATNYVKPKVATKQVWPLTLLLRSGDVPPFFSKTRPLLEFTGMGRK